MVCINSYYRQTSTQSVFIYKDNGRYGEGTDQRSSYMMKCLIIMLRFSEWFDPCKLKATVKRTTKTLRILPPTFKPVSQQIRLLQVAWILTFDWIKFRGRHAIHGSYVTCCKTSLPWAGKKRNMYRFCCKSRTTLYFLQQIFATCNNLICCKTGLNVTTQYHFSTCFAAMLQNKLPFLLPVLSYL